MSENTRQSSKKQQKAKNTITGQSPTINTSTNIESKQNLKQTDKPIFGLIRADSPKIVKEKSKPNIEKQPQCVQQRVFFKKRKREGTFNTGRWMPDEHHRFIEALLKYGNEWKSVQKHVGTRSSTQARSHAQKFFVKIGKTKIENLSLDFANNSLKSLNQMANNLDNEQMTKAIQMLNQLAYDKKGKIRRSRDLMDLSSEMQINLNDYQSFEDIPKRKRLRTTRKAKKLNFDENEKIEESENRVMTRMRKNSIDYYMQHYPVVNFMKDNFFNNCRMNNIVEEEFEFSLVFQDSFKFEDIDFEIEGEFYLANNDSSSSTQRKTSLENDVDNNVEKYLHCN